MALMPPLKSSDAAPGAEMRSTRQWSVAEKLRVLGAAAQVTGTELGELLRREGLHGADLALWRAELTEALESRGSLGASADRRIRELQRELNETKALLELQKKVELLFGADDAGSSAPRKDEK